MAYKYVLVGIYYDGKEPTMFPNDGDFDLNEQLVIETELHRLLQDADWNRSTKHLSVGVIKDGLSKDWFWRRWTWRHVGEVIEHYLWRAYLLSRKVTK